MARYGRDYGHGFMGRGYDRGFGHGRGFFGGGRGGYDRGFFGGHGRGFFGGRGGYDRGFRGGHGRGGMGGMVREGMHELGRAARRFF